jgi:signal peptidase I
MRRGYAGFGVLAGLAALAAAVGVLRRQIAIVEVFGPSMEPALNTGDRVLVRRARVGDLRPGNIVVIEKPEREGGWVTRPPRWPADSREWLIKRVAALPGDPRPGALGPAVIPGSPVVPADRIVVLGDNTARSLDSRDLGYIPAERLLGVMVRSLRPAWSSSVPPSSPYWTQACSMAHSACAAA